MTHTKTAGTLESTDIEAAAANQPEVKSAEEIAAEQEDLQKQVENVEAKKRPRSSRKPRWKEA